MYLTKKEKEMNSKKMMAISVVSAYVGILGIVMSTYYGDFLASHTWATYILLFLSLGAVVIFAGCFSHFWRSVRKKGVPVSQ
jgi:hypothetical protein